MLNSGSTNNRQWFHNWQINQHNHHKTPTHLKHHTTMHIVYQINQYYAMWLNNDTMHVVPFIFAMPNKATTNFANVDSSQQQFIFANYAMHVTHSFNNNIYMQLPYIGIQHNAKQGYQHQHHRCNTPYIYSTVWIILSDINRVPGYSEYF